MIYFLTIWLASLPTLGHFPGVEAAMKLSYLVLNNAAEQWKRRPGEWLEAPMVDCGLRAAILPSVALPLRSGRGCKSAESVRQV